MKVKAALITAVLQILSGLFVSVISNYVTEHYSEARDIKNQIKASAEKKLDKGREKLTEEYGEEEPLEIDKLLTIKKQQLREIKSKQEAELESIHIVRQKLVKTAEIFNDLGMSLEDGINLRSINLKKEHQLFKRKERGLIFCPNRSKCIEVLQTLKEMNAVILRTGLQAINWIDELTKEKHQELSYTRWEREDYQKKTENKFSQLTKSNRDSLMANIDPILKEQRDWSPEKYSQLIE